MAAPDVKKVLADQEKLDKVVKAAFDQVDKDKSGFIDRSELKEAMRHMSADAGVAKPSEEEVAKVMEHLDQNKDGQISFEEFKVLIIAIMKSVAEE